jgi:hypothetical protein
VFGSIRGHIVANWYDRELAVAPFKRLVNRQEEKAHGELKSVAEDYGYVVYLKVRVADVLPIEIVGLRGSNTLMR